MRNLIKKFKFKKGQKVLKPIKNLGFLGTKIFVIITLIFVAYSIAFVGRVMPNVYVAGVDVSGLTPNEAEVLLNNRLALPEKIRLIENNEVFELDLSTIDFEYDLELSAYSAYNVTRTGNVLYDIGNQVESLWKRRDLGLRTSYNEEEFNEFLSVTGGQMVIEPIIPKATFTDGKILIEKGQLGQDINLEKLKRDITSKLTHANASDIQVETITSGYTITSSEEERLAARALKLIGKKLTLTFEFQIFNFSEKDTIPMLDPKGGYSELELNKIIDNLSRSIERAPQNPHFVFDQGKVKEFTPAKSGVAIDKDKFRTGFFEKMGTLEGDKKEATLEVAVMLTEPEVGTGEVNDLGIKELIGRGSSRFTGSIPSRVFNVNLAATTLNGVLIKPGEEFSFVGTIGDISKLTGYKEAYVIKDGKTVLGDGGGVCQVSTTIFRAALNAGLPITERRAHAYRVGYYEQDSGPGLDATIYSPTTDFKFKNDTSGHILIQAYPDTKNLTLVFELYGTSDGRVATVTKPVTSGVTPPADDLYVDDPTLPAGQIKQVEHKAWGAKSVFDYKVEKNGQVVYEKTFVSNYRPWQAVFLRGTGPAQ